MKKLLFIVLLLMSFGITTSAFAATTITPPSAVGNYNDFGKVVQLDIYVKGTNTKQFKVYWKKSNTSATYKSFYVSSTPNYVSRSNQQAVRTGFIAPDFGWYDYMVVSVGTDGKTSIAWKGSILVLR